MTAEDQTPVQYRLKSLKFKAILLNCCAAIVYLA